MLLQFFSFYSNVFAQEQDTTRAQNLENFRINAKTSSIQKSNTLSAAVIIYIYRYICVGYPVSLTNSNSMFRCKYQM